MSAATEHLAAVGRFQNQMPEEELLLLTIAQPVVSFTQVYQ